MKRINKNAIGDLGKKKQKSEELADKYGQI